MGALVDSGANGGMAGMDTRVLSTVLHAHVDITGVGGSILERLPLVQCASVVDTVDEGKIVLIMSQYAHKPDSKTIHSKSQLESFGSWFTILQSRLVGTKSLSPMRVMSYPYMSAMASVTWT